jgi:RHS repeat-associated protein
LFQSVCLQPHVHQARQLLQKICLEVDYYDLRGLQTKARFDHIGGEGITNAYDGLGRLVSSTSDMGGTARTVSTLYDRDGNRTRLTHPDSIYVTYDLDGLGRPTWVRCYGNDPVTGFTYDDLGRRSTMAWGGIVYSYDPAGRLQGLSHNPLGTHRDLAFGFTYNPASQVLTRSTSNDAYAWTGSASASRPHAVNGQNQYLSAGAATFGYDPNGNLSSSVNSPSSTTYVYDVENRLVSASGAHNAELVYDPLGRLAQVSSAAGVRRLVYDGDALVIEYDGAGTLAHRYIHGNDPGTDDPLVWYDILAEGWRRILLPDNQGTVVGVVDMWGNSIATNTYDEYGIPGGPHFGRFGYTGQTWVPELGLWYYKARFYSPTLGRFLQVDPVGYNGGIHLYAYVRNDPLNKSDPTGLSPLDDPTTFEASQGRGFNPPPARDWLETLVDFTPVVGDIKAAYEAYENPTAVNIIIAGIGIVPGVGDLAGKVIRSLERGARTLEKRALQHEAKAAREAANPTVRPGMERRSPQEIAKQQQTRQNHLRGEAAEFRKQAQEKRRLADQLRKELNE